MKTKKKQKEEQMKTQAVVLLLLVVIAVCAIFNQQIGPAFRQGFMMPAPSGAAQAKDWNPGYANAKATAKKFGLDVKEAYYSKDGKSYRVLTQFPGALMDGNGYVVFASKDEYMHAAGVDVKTDHPFLKTTIQNGISGLPGYVKVRS